MPQTGTHLALDSTFGKSETRCDLAVGIPAVVGQHDDLTFLLIEALERPTDSVGFDSSEHLRLGRSRIGTAGFDCSILPAAAGLFRSHPFDGSTVRLSIEIGAQGAAIGFETLRFVPESEKDLLCDVLGQAVVVEDPAAEAEDRASMSLVDLREGTLGALKQTFDQIPVGRDRPEVL